MMRLLILLVLLTLALPTIARDITERLDSLESELPDMPLDTNKVIAYERLSFQYGHIDPDKGFEFGKKGLALAEKLKWKKGLANIYIALAANHRTRSEYDETLDYLNRALKIYQELDLMHCAADTYKDIGITYENLSEYHKALEYYNKGLNLAKEVDFKDGLAPLYNSIGLIHFYQSDYTVALDKYFEALKIYESKGNKKGISIVLNNLGTVSFSTGEYGKAMDYFRRTYDISLEIGDKMGAADALMNCGGCYTEYEQFDSALVEFEKAMEIYLELDSKRDIAMLSMNMGIVNGAINNFTEALQLLNNAENIYREIGIKDGIAGTLAAIGDIYLNIEINEIKVNPAESKGLISINRDMNLNKAISNFEQAVEIFKEIGQYAYTTHYIKRLALAFRLNKDYKKEADYVWEYAALKDSVYNKEKAKEITRLENERENLLKDRKIAVLNERENASRRERSIIVTASIMGFLMILGVLFIIVAQRKRSEKLLLNILPAAIAKRLKAKEHPIADHFENASVVFIDIVGFTKIASDRDSNQIVNSLNIIFTKFDEIAAKYKLEKIKTIGDSYMAVTGVPIPDSNHAENMAKFALEVKAEMHNYRTEDETLIQFRIGIDCGDVVAGVIGSNKFIYDLWGDTVNTASRMESNGTPDEIHVSERFRDTLADSFQFEERGEIDIKGKGLMMTYYLKGEKVD